MDSTPFPRMQQDEEQVVKIINRSIKRGLRKHNTINWPRQVRKFILEYDARDLRFFYGKKSKERGRRKILGSEKEHIWSADKMENREGIEENVWKIFFFDYKKQ